jgi:hypothetical protein
LVSALSLPLFSIALIGIGIHPRKTRNGRLQVIFLGTLLAAAFSTQIACGGGGNNKASILSALAKAARATRLMMRIFGQLPLFMCLG